MDDCIEWAGARDRGGYGNTTYQGRHHTTHRVAWIKANGPIPDGLVVMHKCDNPPCINLAHLQLGTASDNMRDMIAKGRKHSGITLSMEKATQIRQILKTEKIAQHELGKRFGVSQSVISEIKNNTLWAE